MTKEDIRNEGYDDAIDAIGEGDPYYLECSNGHASMPPRRLCPECGDDDLSEVDMPTSGELISYNVTYVPTPDFADDTPYVLGIAEFGDVRLTGQIRAEADDVEVGMPVSVGLDESETTGERLIAFDLE
jgi:hypothetical protein